MPTRHDTRVTPIVMHLLHLDEPPSIRSLARQVELSERRLQELFKEATGTTIRSFVKSWRVHRAAAMLVRTGRVSRIKEMQFEAGYASPATFTHEFKSHFGLTPSELRRAQNIASERSWFECASGDRCPWKLVTRLLTGVDIQVL